MWRFRVEGDFSILQHGFFANQNSARASSNKNEKILDFMVFILMFFALLLHLYPSLNISTER